MFRLSPLALAVALLPSMACAESPVGCVAPTTIEDGWVVSEPQAQQLDPVSICAMRGELQKRENADPHGVVVVRNGAIVYETYFVGPDQRWPQQHWGEPLQNITHDIATRHDLQSMTKSVVALLVGIALDRGMIKSVDVPLLSFFPEYADLSNPERNRITLRDLLTMRAGLDWPIKPYLAMARRVDASPDPYRVVLEQPMVAQPGKRWRYNNGAAELVGGVVQKATGRRLDQFAKEALFEPLGITDWEWGRMANGDPGASWGLRLRPRDLAKIGQLVLNHGAWRGRQIVSSAWIDDMIAPHVVRPKTTYGYLWWLSRRAVGGHDVNVVSAIGWGGQYLDIVPSLNLVVVVTAGAYDFNGGGHPELAGEAVLETVLHAAK